MEKHCFIELDNQLNIPLPLLLLEKILSHIITTEHQSTKKKYVELLIVDDTTMKNMNKKYRHIDLATDVLSFPLIHEDGQYFFLGSVVINYEYALREAQKYGHSIDEEIALLFIHGTLHLLGYDHENDYGEHRQKEQEIISSFCLPMSLCVRTEQI